MKSVLPLFVLIAVIAVAGCTLPFSGSSGGELTSGSPEQGVIFSAFQAIVPEVQAGSNIALYTQVRNVGEFKAEVVEVTLFNCGSISDPADAEGKGCNEEVPLGELQKPDFDLGISGQPAEQEFRLKTDGVHFPVGRSVHGFSARLAYDYKTTSSRDVIISTFQNYQDQGGVLDTSALAATRSPAPVALSLNAPTTPILVSGSDPATLSVAVSASNAGTGVIDGNRLTELKLCYDNGKLDVSTEEGALRGLKEDTTEDVLAPRRCLLPADEDAKKLIGVKQPKRDWTAKFIVTPGAIAIQDVVSFDAEAAYRYSTDTSTQVVVLSQ